MTRVSVEDEAKKCRKRKRGQTCRGPVDDLIEAATTPSDEETDEDDSEPSPPSSPPYNSLPTIHHPNTPSNAIHPKNPTELTTPQSTNSIISHPHSSGGSRQMIEGGSRVSVGLDLGDAEYVVEIKRRNVTSSTNEPHIVEDTKKQLAQSAGMLFLQAKILHDMGEQLLAQYRACFEGNSAPRIDFTRD